jgi:hypothetical protein
VSAGGGGGGGGAGFFGGGGGGGGGTGPDSGAGGGGGGGGSDLCNDSAPVSGCNIGAMDGTGTGAGAGPGDAQVVLTYTFLSPIVTSSLGSTTFTAGGHEVPVDAAVTVQDLAFPTLESGTVAITGHFIEGEDVLGFTNTNPTLYGDIMATYSPDTGVLTLTSAGGSATVAQWQAALRMVTYDDTSGSPYLGTRTVTFAVNDGTNESDSAAKSIVFARAASAVTISATHSSSLCGVPLILTASVAGLSPTGTVSFFDGGLPIGTGALTDGTASIATSTLAVGNHTITASYGGDSENAGSSSAPLVEDIVGRGGGGSSVAPTPNGTGYWISAPNGGVGAFGSAQSLGSMVGQHLNAPIVGIASSPDGLGYWLVGADGGVFSFGDASFLGSMGGQHLNAPIVGIASSPDGLGYWLVASDGGVFSFGDASYYGSLGNVELNRPVVGLTPTADGHGYWLVGADGGVFAEGDAPFDGTIAGSPNPVSVIALLILPAGTGYQLVDADGFSASFGI